MTTTNSPAGFQDIFYDVVSHLAADLEVFDASYRESSHSKSVRRTLARLARVNSAISRPALVALWRRLWDDRPLRHLLWAVGIARKTSSYCQWEIPPLEVRIRPKFWPKSSWERFQEYASLVHEIVLDPFIRIVDIPLQSKIWQDNFWYRLSSVVDNIPILPNLRAASLLTSIPFVDRPFDIGVLCLLNSSIYELNIVLNHPVPWDEVKARTALLGCFSSFRNLEVLSVNISFPPDLGSLVQLYPRLHHLKLRTNCQVNSNHLTLLSAFRRLEYLSIDLSHDMELNVPVTFPRLRILTVLSGGFTPIHALIAHMDAPRLHTLSVSESYTSTTQTHAEMQTVLRPLVVKCPLLTAFEWKSTKIQVQPRPVDGALAELIDPLLSHHTLQSFSAHFHGGAAVRCTPADFRAMAEAWPDLEFFHLCDTGHRLASEQYADLESLLVFTRRCPRLRSLPIPDVECSMDAKSIRDTVEGSSTSTSTSRGRAAAPHGLRELRVMVMRSVGCSEELAGDADRPEVEGWRRWVEDVFPFAMIRVPG